MSPIEFDGEDILIDGVPSRRLVEHLKGAGLSDEAVTDLLGQLLTREPVVAAATAQPFQFQTEVAETAPECAADYERGFIHPDFFDGLTVVQAGQTPEELGFNFRFHAIEGEFDAIATNLLRLSNCLAELRKELFGIARELETKVTEIDDKLATKGKEKDAKDTKEKEKDIKEKEQKDGKDKEKDHKDGKDKEKDHKDGKEKELKEALDKAGPVEKAQPAEQFPVAAPPRPTRRRGRAPRGEAPAAPPGEAPAERQGGSGRAFIRPDERPAVGDQALGTGAGGGG
jgi:hypothetical protein